jgi:hypothetical protein
MTFLNILVFLVSIFSLDALAQVAVTRMPDLPKSFCGLGEAGTEGWIERYEIQFLTKNRWGNDHLSSGLVAFHKNLGERVDPLLYLHATTSKLEVPSKGSFESKFVVCRTLSSNRILIAPDYVGMGDDEMAHGYMIRGEVNRTALDMLIAVNNWFDRSQLSKSLTIAGYSQGGHSALSFHHFLDHHETDYVVKKTFAMSAPANLSKDMLSVILDGRPSANTTYLMSLVLANYQEYYGDIFDESPFRSKYAAASSYAVAMDTKKLKDLLPLDPRDALRPDFVRDLEQNLNHSLRQRLAENDIPPWAASAPIVLSYSAGDDTIVSATTANFIKSMKRFPNDISMVKTAAVLPHGVNFVRSVKWLGRVLN